MCFMHVRCQPHVHSRQCFYKRSPTFFYEHLSSLKRTSYDFKWTYVYTYITIWAKSSMDLLDITRYKRQNVSNSLYVGHITGTSD